LSPVDEQARFDAQAGSKRSRQRTPTGPKPKRQFQPVFLFMLSHAFLMTTLLKLRIGILAMPIHRRMEKSDGVQLSKG